jgi:hypothetical protein
VLFELRDRSNISNLLMLAIELILVVLVLNVVSRFRCLSKLLEKPVLRENLKEGTKFKALIGL